MNRAFRPVFDPPTNGANGTNGTTGTIGTNGEDEARPKDIQEELTAEDMEALQALQKYHSKDGEGLENFTTDVIDGLVPRLETGRLTLVPATQKA